MAIPVGGTRQPIASRTDSTAGNVGGASGVVAEGGVVGETRSVIKEDESLEENGFDVGMFRSRSGHVTGDYPMERATRRESSEGSSTHEQLHYGASVDTESGDLSRIANGVKEQVRMVWIGNGMKD
jgi:hypothetical protein